MKTSKIRKLVVLFAALFVVAFSTVTVQAKTVTDKTHLYYYDKSNAKDYVNVGSVNTTYLSSNAIDENSAKKITALKSSDTKIGTVSVYTMTDNNGKKSYLVKLIMKKTGKITVSYKRGKDIYKIPVAIKAYENPFASFKMNGVSIKQKFNNTSVLVLPFSKYKGKKVTFTNSVKKPWQEVYECAFVNGKSANHTLVSYDDFGKQTCKVTEKNTALCYIIGNPKNHLEEHIWIVFK